MNSVQRTRAKLVVSDLHLGEGRRHWDGSLNLLEDFTVDARFVEFIDYYARAYDEVEFVLNGNFIEMLRCRAVPDYPDMIYETYAVEMANIVIDGHKEVFDALKRFMENPSHNIVYLVGDSDRGVLWSAVQRVLKTRISQRIKFHSGPYRDFGIHIEHGHQYEEMLKSDESDPIKVVDNLEVLKLPWGAFFYAHFVLPLRRLRPQFYRVRPMWNYLIWALLFETRFLIRVVWQFFRMIFSARSRKLFPGNTWNAMVDILSPSADTEALEDTAEQILSTDEVSKVIFGHSHIPNYRQFRNAKEYFNSGTWTKNLSLDLRTLGSFHRLTYVLVELPPGKPEPQARLMEWFGRHSVVEDFV